MQSIANFPPSSLAVNTLSLPITLQKAMVAGAIAALDGNITIIGSISFMKNHATFRGGAIHLSEANLILSGNISFVNNEAYNGGALSTHESYLFISENCLNIKITATSLTWNVVTK